MASTILYDENLVHLLECMNILKMSAYLWLYFILAMYKCLMDNNVVRWVMKFSQLPAFNFSEVCFCWSNSNLKVYKIRFFSYCEG